MTLRDLRAQRRARLAAGIAVGLIALVVVISFAKGLLAGEGYRVHAIVSDANQLRRGSDVRIGGVRVGRVTRIDGGPNGTAELTLHVDDDGRPVRRDATLTVKPRLVLEGNAYLDLSTGTPSAPELSDGGTIPLAHTAVTPQLDQVLSLFDAPTRGALARGVAGLADGLGNGTRDATDLQGSGTRGVRRAVKELDLALDDVAVGTRAVRGRQPGDLPRAVRGTGDLVAQLSEDPRALADGVTHFDEAFGALADEHVALGATLRELDRTLRVAPAGLRELDGALPAIDSFAVAARPALAQAPGALRSADATLAQIGAVTRRAELPATLDRLEPITARLPTLETRLRTLFTDTDKVTSCLATHVIPVLDAKVPDGSLSTGDPVWLDLLHAFTGFTSASTSYDGNGGTFRAGLAFGGNTVAAIVPGLGTIAGGSDSPIAGVRPAWLGYGVDPAYRPDQPCADQKLPDLATASAPAPRWARLGSLPRARSTGR